MSLREKKHNRRLAELRTEFNEVSTAISRLTRNSHFNEPVSLTYEGNVYGTNGFTPVWTHVQQLRALTDRMTDIAGEIIDVKRELGEVDD